MSETRPSSEQETYSDAVVYRAQAHLFSALADIVEAGGDPADFDPLYTGLSPEIAGSTERTREFLHTLRKGLEFTRAEDPALDLDDPLSMLRWLDEARTRLNP